MWPRCDRLTLLLLPPSIKWNFYLEREGTRGQGVIGCRKDAECWSHARRQTCIGFVNTHTLVSVESNSPLPRPPHRHCHHQRHQLLCPSPYPCPRLRPARRTRLRLPGVSSKRTTQTMVSHARSHIDRTDKCGGASDHMSPSASTREWTAKQHRLCEGQAVDTCEHAPIPQGRRECKVCLASGLHCPFLPPPPLVHDASSVASIRPVRRYDGMRNSALRTGLVPPSTQCGI